MLGWVQVLLAEVRALKALPGFTFRIKGLGFNRVRGLGFTFRAEGLGCKV